jgi:hypothetical protein
MLRTAVFEQIKTAAHTHACGRAPGGGAAVRTGARPVAGYGGAWVLNVARTYAQVPFFKFLPN